MAILLFEEGLDGCCRLVVRDIKSRRVPFISQLFKYFVKALMIVSSLRSVIGIAKMALVS